VPKKVMFNTAAMKDMLHDAKGYCFSVDHVEFDYRALKAKRDAYVKRLNGIYETNLERDKVVHVQGKNED
jgi:glutathione reductase (NADPH)